MATLETFGDECPDAFLGRAILSVPMVAHDFKVQCHFGYMPLGSSFGRQKGRIVLPHIQRLVGGAGLPATNSMWNVLCLANCSLCDHLLLMELRQMLNSKRPEAELIIVEAARLEERVCKA